MSQSSAQNESGNYLIGFSQCTTADIWRETMHREMLVELMLFPRMDMELKDAEGSSQKQVEHIREFLEQDIDLLIVSPNESEPLTPIVEQVYNSGIPVIVIDRKINSDKYTAYIGANNYLIGREAGKFAVSLLHGKGNIIEISGLKGSSPAQERHRGFIEEIRKHPEIQVIFSGSGKWNFNGGKAIMESALKLDQNVDLVFAHNDFMAAGAYEIYKQSGRSDEMHFIGIDGLAGDEGGLQYVIDGILDATLLYPTGGERAIQLAWQILNDEVVEKENILQTVLIDGSNASVIKAQTEYIRSLQGKVEIQSEKYFDERFRFVMAMIVLGIIVLLAAMLLWAFYLKRRANQLLEKKNQEIEKQKQEILERNEKLREITRLLEEATQAKLQFFTNISHEFRTPLTLIMGPLENIMRDGNFTPDHQRQFVMIHRNVLRLLRLINQLMDFRKLENNKMQLSAGKYDLIDFCNEIHKNFWELAQKKQITFNLITTLERLEVWFDKDKLDKILFNLLSNAFKFTAEHGEIKIFIRQAKKKIDGVEKECAEIEITDNGRGMSQEHVKRIFERFYQISRQSAEGIQGTGIGLSLTKSLVDLHHGSIDVESEKDRGTGFTVTLPLGRDHLSENEILSTTEDQGKPDLQIRSEKTETDILPVLEPVYDSNTPHPKTFKGEFEAEILLVEDNADIREYIRGSLPENFRVLEAENGVDGLKMLDSSSPDLIISDVMMPEMDGLEMTKKIKSDIKTCHIPVILLTAKASLEHKLEGLEIGADSYIPKPFNSRHLQVRIQKLIENRQHIRRHYRENLAFEEQNPSISNLDKSFLDKMLEAIQKNMSNSNFGVEDLSREVGMSRVHLYRKVKQLTDMSVTEFIRSIKLKKAMQLLKESGKNVNEVAMETGFATPSYFAKCFKEQYKVSPSEVLRR